MAAATISGLHVYPVKSLKGILLRSSMVEKRGLRHDRRWVLVDETGLFMSQRDDPRLALFGTEIQDGGLIVASPCGEQVLVPFEPRGEICSVRIWKDTCQGIRVGDGVDAWLSDVLGMSCSLVYMADHLVRPTNPEFTMPGDMVGFADAYPLLVIGESSLAELNSKMDSPLPMNRFRPNIVVKGWEPHAEDQLSEIRIGDLTLRAAKHCARCSITATDQDTAEVGVEPLRTLAKYRLRDQKVYFGAYFVPTDTGTVAVGQAVLGSVREAGTQPPSGLGRAAASSPG